MFKVDGIIIKTPTSYKPVLATTSTEDSGRTQDLVLHNVVLGTVIGFDMQWDCLTSLEIYTILNAMIDKSSFLFYHRSPLSASGWETASFQASNFNMAAQRLQDGQELWSGLTINVRSINPV